MAGCGGELDRDHEQRVHALKLQLSVCSCLMRGTTYAVCMCDVYEVKYST